MTAENEKIIDQTGENLEGDENEPEEGKPTDEGAVDEGEGGAESRQVSEQDDEIQGDAKDPKYQAALKAQETLNSILESQGYESTEELTADLESGKSLLELFGGDKTAAEDAIAASKRLNEYEAYWAEQEERARREKESPEETIKRIEQEKKELEQREKQQEAKAREKEKLEKTMKAFEKNVNTALKAEFGGEIPETHQAIVDLVTGLKNPLLDVEMESKRDVVATTKEVVKAVKAFEDAIIQGYLKGKRAASTKQTGGSASGGETPAQGEKKVKNLKDARKTLMEMFTGSANR